MKFLYKDRIMLNFLIVTSVVMFFSLFTGINKLVGITMSLFLINLFWVMFLLVGGKGFSNVLESSEIKINEAKEEKNYLKEVVYTAALPLCAVGLIIIILQVGMLFFM